MTSCSDVAVNIITVRKFTSQSLPSQLKTRCCVFTNANQLSRFDCTRTHCARLFSTAPDFHRAVHTAPAVDRMRGGAERERTAPVVPRSAAVPSRTSHRRDMPSFCRRSATERAASDVPRRPRRCTERDRRRSPAWTAARCAPAAKHTHTFSGPLSGTTRVCRYQKGKTNQDFTEARDSEWQWQQLGRMQVCTSLQTDNHASTPPLSFLQAGCPSCRPTNSVKALKAKPANIKLIFASLTKLWFYVQLVKNRSLWRRFPVCVLWPGILA